MTESLDVSVKKLEGSVNTALKPVINVVQAPQKIGGATVDFLRAIVDPKFTEEQKAALKKEGYWT